MPADAMSATTAASAAPATRWVMAARNALPARRSIPRSCTFGPRRRPTDPASRAASAVIGPRHAAFCRVRRRRRSLPPSSAVKARTPRAGKGQHVGARDFLRKLRIGYDAVRYAETVRLQSGLREHPGEDVARFLRAIDEHPVARWAASISSRAIASPTNSAGIADRRECRSVRAEPPLPAQWRQL